MSKSRWWCACAALGLVVAAVSRGAGAATFDPSLHWQQRTTPHFSLYFDQQLAPVAERAAQLVEEVYQTLSPKYHWTPLGHTAVVLTDNFDDANGYATVLPYNYLLLRVTPPPADSPLAYYDDWLRMLIMHEFTHIIHMDQVGGIMRVPRALFGKMVSPNGVVPGWMKEGLAVHEETLQTQGGRGAGSFADMILRTEILQKKFPAIDQADGLGWKWPGYLPQYIHGGKFVGWLARKYGEEKLVLFQNRTARSPIFFMHNHEAKRVWGKSFYRLWKEFRVDCEAHYAPQLQKIRAAGVTPLAKVTDDGTTLAALAVSPDGDRMVYESENPHRLNELRLRDLGDGSERVVSRGLSVSSAAIDPFNVRIAFAAPWLHKKYNFFSDIYVADLLTGKLVRVTQGRRASDPSFSADGKELLYVVSNAGQQKIVRYNLATRKETPIPIVAGPDARFSAPHWSPDGKLIAVSSWQHGQRDLYLYHADGTMAQRLTNDRALDLAPAWDHDGRLYFSSDRSGVSNIYRYDPKQRAMVQMTNVETGAFLPQPTRNGQLLLQYYHGDGFGIRRVALDTIHAVPASETTNILAQPLPPSDVTAQAYQPADAASQTAAQKYHPFGAKLFVPRYFLPNVLATGSGVVLSGATGGSDPLRWHNWVGGATYRTDAKHTGYFASYYYNRHRPVFSLGVMDYAVDFGDLTFSTTAVRTVHVFEKRVRGYAGVLLPWRRHNFHLQYFFEKRSDISGLTPAEAGLLNFNNFAGISGTYAWGRAFAYPASISKEKGHNVLVNFTMTDKLLGSSTGNEQQIAVADLREFVPLPWRHHVIALHAKSGFTWGDTLVQGTFAMGGALGEGALAGGGSLYYFPLRGLPVAALSKQRALLLSAEYRVPLVSPQRGLGTWPVFVKTLHAAAFADFGNAWSPSDVVQRKSIQDYFLTTGLEFRGDFVLGHGLPVTGRLGYGIVLLNRSRLGTVKDPPFNMLAKNGTIIMQFGTSF